MTAPAAYATYPGVADTEPGQPAPRSRHDALAAATARVRVRRGGNIPVEQILLVLASILFPLGLVFIFLGWEGAAHTGHSYEQMDYLISGGILGLALSAGGGFMYFGYWLSRQLRESRRQSALTLQALQRIEDAMSGAATAATAATAANNGHGIYPPPQPEQPAPARAANGRRRRGETARRERTAPEDPTREVPVPMLIVTSRGSLMHRPDCPVVTSRPGVKAVPATTPGYGFCTMCDAAGVVDLEEHSR